MVALATSRALGTGIKVGVTEDSALDGAREVVDGWLDRIDVACSRFREDSDLSRVNAGAGERVPVSPLCAEAVALALRVAAATGGLVDPTVGAALVHIGYDRDFSLVVVAPGPETGRSPAPGWAAVEVDTEAGTVRVPQGVRLDLGASAKALAADHAAADAAARTGSGVLVSLGGDIAVAGPAPDGGWQVLVTDDHDAALDAPGQVVGIASGGLATSSTTVRRWMRDGASLHHIVDPRTGLPAETPLRTVSVAAESCVAANAASTAAIILGEAASAWLHERGLPARLVTVEGSVTHLGGWPEQGERP